MSLIKSFSYNQKEIIQNALSLHAIDGPILDPAYGKGNMWPDVDYKFDINPQTEDTQQGDCRKLPFKDGEIATVIFDPPFLATKRPSLKKKSGNIINKRFSVFPTEKELFDFYMDSLYEFWRVLKKKGIVIFKCQDKVSSGKQYWSHCLIWEMAREIGFYPVDLFVLLAKNRIVANWQKNQKHARKFHAYFWVLRKV